MSKESIYQLREIQQEILRFGRTKKRQSGLENEVYSLITRWIAETHNTETCEFLFNSSAVTTLNFLQYLTPQHDVGDGWRFQAYERIPCTIMPSITAMQEDQLSTRTGAMRFTFAHTETHATFEVIVVTVALHDAELSLNFRSVACVPSQHIEQWVAFDKECKRIENSAIQYRGKVFVVGGADSTFSSTTTLDEVYLPTALKEEIMRDINAFFERGVTIYTRLNIKPFRKFLLAGVPGTGKTMLCGALANWATQQDFFVAYVSGSNAFGARFWKIHQALDMAASSGTRALVIVEELDAYLQDNESMAEMLNVLDGMETPANEYGTLLIATTNHPEKIDDRVLKRPGRLDRVFIVPEMDDRESAARMLRNYIGDSWREEHEPIVDQLLGKPGAFIREVVLYALTMSAYQGEEQLSLARLEESLKLLEEQIDAKDDFLTNHKQEDIGFGVMLKRSKRPRFTSFED